MLILLFQNLNIFFYQ